MLLMLSLSVAIVAMAIGAGAWLAGWMKLRQARQQMEEIRQAQHLLAASQESRERVTRELQATVSEAMSARERMQATLSDLEERFAVVENYAAVCVPPRPSPSGLNINNRLEAARRLRDGDSEQQVSEELGIALSELRLIAHLEKTKPAPEPKRRRRVA
jgi:hypothetical protein